MTIAQQLAKNLRDVYLGENWTSVNIKKTLDDISWEEATQKVYNLNTIATLVNHLNYYVKEVAKVLDGQPLLAKDKYSFEHPPIKNQEDWSAFKESIFKDCENFAIRIEKLSVDELKGDFIEKKYGTNYRNLSGIIEHIHYHLGQIVIIKKIIKQK